MKKYKVCPSCGTRNEPTLLECMACEADLTRVQITDEEAEQAAPDIVPEPTGMVRVCECGQSNPANARKCSACGEDISDIVPAPEAGPEEENSFVLSSLDGQYAFRVPAGETVIGREGAMAEYLAGKNYVSRMHARLALAGGALYIENLSRTNGTFVSGRRISERTKLEDGDELGLGGLNRDGARPQQAAFFFVRIGTCI